MKINLDFEPVPVWNEFYDGDWRQAILIGARGSAKTWNASNLSMLNTHKNPFYRTLIARDVGGSIAQSILDEIKQRYQETKSSLPEPAQLEYPFETQETQIKYNYKVNGNIESYVNLMKVGFRKSQKDQQADLKGFSNVNLLIVEEAEDIRDKKRFKKLLHSLKTKGFKVIIILNTTDLSHWVIQTYFDYEPTEYEGYYRLIPKKINGVLQIITNYKDNPYLDEKYVEDLEAQGDPNSPFFDLDYYLRDVLGYATENPDLKRKFNVSQVKALKVTEPLATLQGLKLYKDIVPNAHYVIGIDPSTGLSSDYTGFTCREFDNGYPLVAQGKLKKTPVETATLIAWLFNDIISKGGKCTVALETMEQAGGEVLAYLKDLIPQQYLYRARQRDPNNPQKWIKRADFGWKTTSANRNVIIAKWALLFQQTALQILNQDEIDEMLVFVEQDGKYQALDKKEGKNQDDLLFSDFICVAVLQELYG